MDDKRFYRNLKKHVKKVGNRKRRRYLKDLDSHSLDFEFGADHSATLNGRDGPNRKRQKDEEGQE
jgi:hypothetical protein